jgi:hypothetical protein
MKASTSKYLKSELTSKKKHPKKENRLAAALTIDHLLKRFSLSENVKASQLTFFSK